MIAAPTLHLREMRSPKISKKGGGCELFCKISGLVKSGRFSEKGGNVRIFYCRDYKADMAIV